MAFIFGGYRPQIAWRMAAGDDDLLRWLQRASFAKTSTGHWLAWRADEPDRAVILQPDHPADTPALSLDDWEPNPTLERWLEYLETGELERNPPGVLNLFIEDPVTGELE